MSARVMNPAMMTEMSRNLSGGGGGGKRATPNREALARVRRDLFGPVDHVAARALADTELKAQSMLDAKRWGFDFRLEIPTGNSRYDWEAIGPQEVVPEPYALRGMPYLRKHAPQTPKKYSGSPSSSSSSKRRGASLSPMITDASINDKPETTPPQIPRVPNIGENTSGDEFVNENYRKKCRAIPEPTTPVLPVSVRKQSSITDYMKSRKRSLNGTKKSIVEPPEKITRNAGQIRS